MNMKRKIVDIVCVCIVAVLFGGIAFFNIFQTNRPTVSEAEKRSLTPMPEFTFEALFDGSYFANVALHVSDTFLYRDTLVTLSQKMDSLKGIDYSLDDNNNFVVIDPGPQTDPNKQTENTGDLSNKIDEAFNDLNNKESQEPDVDPDDPITETDEILPPDPPVPPTPVEPDDSENSDEYSDAEMKIVLENGNIKEYLGDKPTEDPNVIVEKIRMSRSNVSLTIGSGASVYAAVICDGRNLAVTWSVSDPSVISIAPGTVGVNIKAMASGTAKLRCSFNDEIYAECLVTVATITPSPYPDNGEADFLPEGLFIYGDGVYTQAAYNPNVYANYSKTAAYFQQLFGSKTRVSMVIAPVSSMVITNKEVQSKIENQAEIFAKMKSQTDSTVNFVDVYAELDKHKNEYLFYKSDHHWTGLGAYYAYVAFAKSVGLTPTPLSSFEAQITNEKYYGSYSSYTTDPRVKSFYDFIEVFKSRKQHTMTVITPQGTTLNYNHSIVTGNKTYVTFIAGDNTYTAINVPENPQNKNVLVLKDSFGNAFVPYLCEHYGNIIVIDPRHSSINVYEQFKDFGFTDIIFVNNVKAASSSAWPSMYLNSVGVSLN